MTAPLGRAADSSEIETWPDNPWKTHSLRCPPHSCEESGSWANAKPFVAGPGGPSLGRFLTDEIRDLNLLPILHFS